MEQLVKSFGACAYYASLDLFVTYNQHIVHLESWEPYHLPVFPRCSLSHQLSPNHERRH
jgi:hypothetical protein